MVILESKGSPHRHTERDTETERETERPFLLILSLKSNEHMLKIIIYQSYPRNTKTNQTRTQF